MLAFTFPPSSAIPNYLFLNFIACNGQAPTFLGKFECERKKRQKEERIHGFLKMDGVYMTAANLISFRSDPIQELILS